MGVLQDNLVLSTGLIIWILHRKEIRKLTFRALGLRRSESRRILNLDVLLCDPNIIGSSSDISGCLRKSSEKFRNVCLASGQLLENLRKSSKSVDKSSENRQYYFYMIKRTLHARLWIRSLYSRYRVEHSRRKFVSTSGHVISSIYTRTIYTLVNF